MLKLTEYKAAKRRIADFNACCDSPLPFAGNQTQTAARSDAGAGSTPPKGGRRAKLRLMCSAPKVRTAPTPLFSLAQLMRILVIQTQ